MITGEAGESAEAETASVSKPGQTGRTAKASRPDGLFQQETVGPFGNPSGDESLPEQLVYQPDGTGNTIRPPISALV
jgi:hypothetical protein